MTGGELDSIHQLIDDRPADGVFRVNRALFVDPAIFEREITRIFESTWVFVGLDSEVANAHDYVTGTIGRQPIILMRDGVGKLGCFLNSCRHRGTLVCPFAKGNAKFHTCRYHGWTYSSAGQNVLVTDRSHGHYPPAFAEQQLHLTPVARLDSYRGFVFASLSADVPPLATHLGEARKLIDLVADQAPHGLEYVPGSVSYTYDGNWKLQFENGLDAYHFATTHAAFVDIFRARQPRSVPAHAADFAGTREQVVSGTLSFPYGHAVSWSLGAPGQGPEGRPLPQDRELFSQVRLRVGDERVGWMLRQRNLTIFPNLQIIDIQSLQVRSWQPLAVNQTRMHSHCLAPKGENSEARRFRIRQYEEFFNAGGLASSDDNLMYELNQSGMAAVAAGATEGYARGMAAPPADARHFAAIAVETAARTCSTSGLAFGDETAMHSGYREWQRLMRAE